MKKYSLGQWLKKAWHRDSNATALKWKKHDVWETRTWQDYMRIVTKICEQLDDLKIKSNAHVGLLSNTSVQWSVCDVATIASGRVLVPLYASLSDDDVIYILNHAECDALFLEGDQAYSQFERVKNRLKKNIITIRMDEIDLIASSVTDAQVESVIARSELIDREDTITILYTSGTTGTPKGVVMPERALVSEIEETFGLFTLSEMDCSLSFLPFAHVMGRVEHWGSLSKGYTLAFAQSIDTLKIDLKEIKPTLLVAVPRVFEKIYAGILSQVETQVTKKKIFEWARETSKQVQYYRETKQSIPFHVIAQFELAQQLVFKKIRSAFGGRLRFAISGGAPLQAELGQFFLSLGIKVLEGYGLSETFAAIAVNTESQFKFGTVGKPIGDVEIKFAEDGEILVKSDKVMKGYYKDKESTDKSFDGAYFKTGDIGEFTSDGFLKITDRKKDLIKTSGGKYVAPQKLEGLLKQEPLIAQTLIVGDQRKYIVAILAADPNTTEDNKQNRDKMKAQVQKINGELSSFESIKKFEIVFEAWTVENGNLTPSMKIKRKVLEQKYSEIIENLYR